MSQPSFSPSKINSTKIAPYTVFFDNGEEFHTLKREIFGNNVYYFETDTPAPRIIDAGAHIGLTTLYFKKIYPSAQIDSIEPNPAAFALLEQNIEYNLLDGVELHHVALSDKVGVANFFMDETTDHWYSTASFTSGAWTGTQTSTCIQVKTTPLATFLDQPVDFLKMDIEGAEHAVLEACGDQIRQIKHMIVEFHPLPDQSLAELVSFLQSHHFNVTIWKDRNSIEVKRARGLVYVEARQ